jgi:hypothetical protein
VPKPEDPQQNCLPEPEQQLRITAPAPNSVPDPYFIKDLEKFYRKKATVAMQYAKIDNSFNFLNLLKG